MPQYARLFLLSCITPLSICVTFAAPLSLTDLEYRGAIRADAVWQWPTRFSDKIIRVCWENPNPQYSLEMTIVKRAVENSWEKHSKLYFSGWEQCVDDANGIHIVIRDDEPISRWLGRHLNQKRNGLILNFTFRNWQPYCQKGDKADWIADIAVHEFGHALALTHEHNRRDKPEYCTVPVRGTVPDKNITPWDPESEMNYCYCDDDADLSELDIETVKSVYGSD